MSGFARTAGALLALGLGLGVSELLGENSGEEPFHTRARGRSEAPASPPPPITQTEDSSSNPVVFSAKESLEGLLAARTTALSRLLTAQAADALGMERIQAAAAALERGEDSARRIRLAEFARSLETWQRRHPGQGVEVARIFRRARRSDLLFVLARAGAASRDPRARALLREALRDGAPNQRAMAPYGLAGDTSWETLDALADGLERGAEASVGSAFVLAGAAPRLTDAVRRRALAESARRALAGHTALRVEAIDLLVALGDEGAAELGDPTLRRLVVEDADPQIAAAACRGLLGRGASRASLVTLLARRIPDPITEVLLATLRDA